MVKNYKWLAWEPLRAAHRWWVRDLNTGLSDALSIFLVREGYVIGLDSTGSAWDGVTISGPFETLDGAKAAYLLLIEARDR